MENTEWPDAEKLKDLRQTGVFPHSRLSINCITAAILILCTYLQFPNFGRMLSAAKNIYTEPVTNFSAAQTQLRILTDSVITALAVYAFVYLMTFVIMILIQSKFYFSLVNFSFDLSQVVRVRNASLSFFVSGIVKAFLGLFFAVLFGAILFYWVFRQYLGIMFSDAFFGKAGVNLFEFLPVVKSVFALSVLILMILAGFSYLFSRFTFMLKHRTADRFGGRH